MQKNKVGDEVVCISSIGNLRCGYKYKITQIMSNSLFEEKYKFDEHYSFVSSYKFISLNEARRRKILKLKIKIDGK